MNKALRVLVVDDTITYRNILKAALSEIEGVEVVGSASNGEIALEKINQLRPDIITLDIEMPVMDGLQALEEIRKNYPNIGVIMVSGANQKSADATIQALGHGALDFIRKPEGAGVDDSIGTIRSNLKLIISAYNAQPQHHKAPVTPVRSVASLTPTPSIKGFDLLAIGSSTGGPNALMKILPELPSNFPVPIVIVQHMPEGFTASFAKNLDKICQINVCETVDGDILKPGRVYIAPGGRHIMIEKVSQNAVQTYKVITNSDPYVNNCRPSIDVTFKSLARCFIGNILSLILTGMGTDGAEGVRLLKQDGKSYCITQNEQSCVVYGMPRAVDLEGLSDSSLHLDNIGTAIKHLIGTQNYVSN